MPRLSRRRLFSSVIATSALGLGGTPSVSSPAHAESTASGDGGKFYPDGRVKPYPGNTIICHLPQQGPDHAAFDALLNIYRAAPEIPFLRRATLLPPSSYHMTVFEGATVSGRDRPDQWPTGLAQSATLDDSNRYLTDRLKTFKLGTTLPLRMTVDMEAPTPAGSAIIIPIKSADAESEAKIRDLRLRLSAATGIAIPSPDTYRFHISLAYWIRQPSSDEQEQYVKTHLAWRRAIRSAAPVITLGAPEYCLFEDMFAFQRQFYLSD